MVTNLMDGQTATPSTSNPNTDYTIGNRFTVSTTTSITGLRWWRRTTSTAEKPYNLKLWGSNTLQPLAVVAVPNDGGTTGWQLSSLTGSVDLVPGVTYTVSAYWPNGQTWAWIPLASRQAAPSPFTWATNARSNAVGADTFPSTVDNTLIWMIDVQADGTLSGGAPSGGGASAGDVQNSLADWLISTSDNTHQADGLPWLTKTAVDAVKVVTDKLGASGSGNSLDWVKALWDLAGDFSDAEIGWLKGFLSKRDQLVGASGGGGSAFYGPGGTQVAAGVETLLASGITPTTLGAAIALLREQLTLSPDLADTSRWTLVDTTSGDGDALVSQQADAYFFSITAYPSSQAAHGVAATLWLPRWGWVCPRVHGHFAQRQFHDVMPTIITSEGHFMDGLLIYTPPGFEWTCESYVLDR